MNRFVITYHDKDRNILKEDKINALTMVESINRFHQVRGAIRPTTCKDMGSLENCFANQTKEYENSIDKRG